MRKCSATNDMAHKVSASVIAVDPWEPLALWELAPKWCVEAWEFSAHH